MKLVAIMPVRNEAWILGLSARVALQWCDEIEVLLHACTDRSMEILEGVMKDFPQRVTWTLEESASWNEMAHRDYLLNSARYNRRCTPTHIAIIDADEILTANLLPSIRSLVEATPRGYILQLPLYNLRGGVGRYHANGLWGNRTVSVAFADDPRLGWSGDKFHHREPTGMPMRFLPRVQQGEGGVLHFWGASERRLLAKHALYKVTERLRWPNKSVQEIDETYNQGPYGVRVPIPGWDKSGPASECPAVHPMGARWPGPDSFAMVPQIWTAAYSDLMQKHIDVDAEPWQEWAVRDAVATYGAERFAGLDLFGLDDFGKFAVEHPHQHMGEILDRMTRGKTWPKE